MAVVLVLGANPSEQASLSGPRSKTTRAARPKALARIAGDRHQRNGRFRQTGNQPRDFGRLTTHRQRQHHVAATNAAQVAVNGLRRMHEMSRSYRWKPRWP